MAYTVNKTSGALLALARDGTIDNSTDPTFIGKNYRGYGELLNENFVKLLENLRIHRTSRSLLDRFGGTLLILIKSL